MRQSNEVEVGDLILDFVVDAPLPGVGSQRSEIRDLVFMVSGKTYLLLRSLIQVK